MEPLYDFGFLFGQMTLNLLHQFFVCIVLVVYFWWLTHNLEFMEASSELFIVFLQNLDDVLVLLQYMRCAFLSSV